MRNNTKIKISSNRSFGIVFFFVFLIISLWPLINGSQIRVWSILIAIVFLILGLMNSQLLKPLNILWFKFGKLLGSIAAPIVMGFVFFIIVTPIGLFMRTIKKNFFQISFSNDSSYWIKRKKNIGSMKRQF